MAKNVIPDISIDDIIKLNIPSRERISTYFPLGSRFKVWCLRPFELLTHGNGRKSVGFAMDLEMRVGEIETNGPRWLIYKDMDGNEFGLAVEAMLSLHSKSIIDIERIL